MVIARKDDKRWVVASYDDDGAHQGYATGRDTCMFWSVNAAHFTDKGAAERHCTRMERIWPSRIWLVEPAPRTHIDARTGTPLPTEVVRKLRNRVLGGGMDALVAEGFVREQERDEHFGKAYRNPQRNKPTPALDTTRPHALASVLRRQVDSVGDMDEAGIEKADVDDGAGNDKDEGDDMVLARKSGGKKAATVKTGSKAKAVAKVPKMQLRTATAASKRKVAESNGGGPCLCACGSQAVKWFRRGHIKILNSKLAEIKTGTITPEKALGKQIAAAFGPWTKLKAGGQKPATLDFDRVRANV